MDNFFMEFTTYLQKILDSLALIWAFMLTSIVGKLIIATCLIYTLVKVATMIIKGIVN